MWNRAMAWESGRSSRPSEGPLSLPSQQCVGSELVHQPLEPVHQVFFIKVAGAHVHDKGAQVADGAV